jgi:1-acyl-sn-glycerol-3-phosphate acyltransferase
MIAYRYLRVALHLLIGVWTCALVFPLADGAGRTRRIQRWSAQLLGICGVHIEISGNAGSQSPSRALIVSNHISWLDIFVINAIQPCRFVAKSDIRGWPLLGWFSQQAGTVFLARGERRDVRRIFKDLVASIHAGERVAFFPEGTTAGQGGLLPFHANLFEAAIDAKVPVQPYALRYVDAGGAHHAAVEFIGDTTFVQSLAAVLKAGSITAQLQLLAPIDTEGSHRRELAAATRQAVAQALGLAPAAKPECTPLAAPTDLQGTLR